MPEKIQFKPKKELLTFEEMLRISNVLVKEGVNKIRITGGEPFLRKDIMNFLEELTAIHGLKKVAITTNGTQTLQYLDQLLSMGINTFNLSIDSFDKDRFYKITRRDEFDRVKECMETMMDKDCTVRLNAVVMKDYNIEDIIPMVAFTKENNISVRFIEEMPFNGSDKYYDSLEWNFIKILEHLGSHFKSITKLKDPQNSTSLNYRVNGFKGSFGIIPAYTRSFCGSCNRIRITPDGKFKTCLYDRGIFDLKAILRNGANDDQLLASIKDALAHKAKDGFEAEKTRTNNSISESMSIIGG